MVVLLIFGIFVGSVYFKVILCVFLLLWIGLGLGVWLFGDIGSCYFGVSGIIYGLMFLVFVFGLLCCDWFVIVVGLIVFLFYGSMLLIIFLYELGVFW